MRKDIENIHKESNGNLLYRFLTEEDAIGVMEEACSREKISEKRERALYLEKSDKDMSCLGLCICIFVEAAVLV